MKNKKEIIDNRKKAKNRKRERSLQQRKFVFFLPLLYSSLPIANVLKSANYSTHNNRVRSVIKENKIYSKWKEKQQLVALFCWTVLFGLANFVLIYIILKQNNWAKTTAGLKLWLFYYDAIELTTGHRFNFSHSNNYLSL